MSAAQDPSQGQLAATAADLERAVQANPDDWQARHRLGVALARQGRLAEAAEQFRQALRVNGQAAEVQADLGQVLARRGETAEAVAAFRDAIRLRPAVAELHFHLGAALARQRQMREAAAAYEEALRLKPDFPEAHHAYGTLLLELGRPDPAIEHFHRVLATHPQAAAVHANLGVALASKGRMEEAIDSYRQAVRLNPNSPLAYNNLGEGLRHLGRLDEAVTNFNRALGLKPDFAEAHNNLAIVLRYQGKVDEALGHFQEAIHLNPSYVEAHVNRAFVWLAAGDYAHGWPEYEWRWKSKALPARPFTQPRWDGSPLQGRTILVHAEQGLGDTVQFIRYAPLVKERGGQVIVECQDVLIPLLSTCPGIDRLVALGGPLPDFDLHAPLLSLPHVFGTTVETIPAQVPYLFPDPARRERWRPRLEGPRGYKVGIVWQGGLKYAGHRRRSIALAHFAHLARVPGVRLFALQKGPGREQLTDFAARHPITDLGAELDESGGAFMDTAAVMQDLDLVVTTDTALAHVAGAVAVPVWVALPVGADFRWMLDRSDSPWYPTMRLFRQPAWGDWDAVFRHIAEELGRAIQDRTSGGAVRVAVSPGELIDKITILQIKTERITDVAKRANVEVELATLRESQRQLARGGETLRELTAELKRVNETLWDVEDEIRKCERDGNFGPRFVKLARAVYHENDRRAALKRQINELLGSRLVEEKQYVPYAR
jgi:tetratricopeptide (TPR) repeat protein